MAPELDFLRQQRLARAPVVRALIGVAKLVPGSQLVGAVQNRDVTLVQSIAMLIAIIYVVINLAADLIVMLLVPKLREPA